MVSRVVLLDAGPLGLATNPKPSPSNLACSAWLQSLIEAGVRVIVPEIADYEVRRELLRANKINGLALLDTLTESLDYLPLTTSAMRRAAKLWADARQSGQPTAGDNTIDGDVILAAQALSLGVDDYVIATTNVGHLSRFAPAQLWNEIVPPAADFTVRTPKNEGTRFMSINYDPDGTPEVSADMATLARDLGLQVVNIICDEEGAQVGDDTGVSFIAMTPFLPRPGDRIQLEDGRICQTKFAFFKVSRMTGHIGLVPNACATLIQLKE